MSGARAAVLEAAIGSEVSGTGHDRASLFTADVEGCSPIATVSGLAGPAGDVSLLEQLIGD